MLLSHLEKRHRLEAFLAALLLLTRPDALILLGPLALDRLWQLYEARRISPPISQKSPDSLSGVLGELLLFGVPTLAWFAYAAWQFGSPLPHSVAAKTLAYHLPANAAFIRLLQHYANPFMDYRTFGVAATVIGVVLYPFLSVTGGLGMWKREKHSWPLFVYPWTYFCVFALANPLIFRWYLTPPLPMYFFTILYGASNLIEQIHHKLVHRPALPANGQSVRGAWGYRLVYLLFVFIAPFLLSLRDWELHPAHGLDRPAPNMAWYQLELFYRQAAETINSQPHQTADPVLAAGDVGVLGYFTNMRILDTVGLNSAQSTHYYPLDPSYYIINYAIPPRLITDIQPDFVVILEVYGRNGLLKDPDFLKQYRLIRKIPNDIYGSDGMLIFSRQ